SRSRAMPGSRAMRRPTISLPARFDAKTAVAKSEPERPDRHEPRACALRCDAAKQRPTTLGSHSRLVSRLATHERARTERAIAPPRVDESTRHDSRRPPLGDRSVRVSVLSYVVARLECWIRAFVASGSSFDAPRARLPSSDARTAVLAVDRARAARQLGMRGHELRAHPLERWRARDL